MLQLLAAGTTANVRGAENTTGINLAKNIRELVLRVPYANLQTMNGKIYARAVDGRGAELSDFANWSQSLTVQAVDPNRITLDTTGTSPKALRLTASVTHNGQKVCDLSWYAFDGTP